MSSHAAEAHEAEWPAEAGSSSPSGNNRRAGQQDAPAVGPISEQETRTRRVVAHRRSSSSSSTTIVVHNYEMKSTSATCRAGNAPTLADVAPDSVRGSRQPANYANANDKHAERAPGHAERRLFSQANKLPSSPASQRGVNQVRSESGSNGSATSASGRPIESIQSQQQQQQQPQAREQRQIMNNNNKGNCVHLPTNYVVGRNGAPATSKTSLKRARQAQIAPDAASPADAQLEDADYSLIDTPDLQRHSNGNQRQHSAATQMNRSRFYNNLFKTNNEPTGSPRAASRGDAGHRANGRQRRVHEQATMGAARRAKSATLPGQGGGNPTTDFGYDEIGPPAARNGHQHHQQHQQHQRLSRQQVVAHGQAIRNDLITSMKSPQRASMRLEGANGRQNSLARGVNGSTDSNSMAPYGSFGSSSQRASRSSLSARSSRVGKFVNLYPASRQPQPGSPGHKRHTSPYAFHVPPHRLRSPAPRARSPGSTYCPYGSPIQLYDAYGKPAESPHDPNDYDLVQRVAGAEHDDDEASEDSDHLVVAKAEIKQTRYGYVAPLDRIESKQQPLALSKFNKSLKSRTIGHIPSMVQVSVDDNLLSTGHLAAHLSESRDFVADSYNNRSEGDLLKAHRIVWRNSNKFDVGHDNPFKPGTELSLEADLMVRLIKRGYPIDELPHLVQATKEVMAAKQRADSPAIRSKSCDKLGEANSTSRVPKSAGGYLNSNLRQFNDQAYAIEEDSHEGRRKSNCGHSVSHSNLLQSEKVGAQEFTQTTTVDELEPCKRIWANSLSRAKSMPRFNQTAKGEGGNKLKSALFKPNTMKDDVDSLDKLISDIEREISDLLVSEPDTKDPLELNRNAADCAVITENGSTEAVKSKQRNSPKRKIVTPNSSPKRESKSLAGQQREKVALSTSTTSFAEVKRKRGKNDLTSSRSDELLLDSEGNSTMLVNEKTTTTRKKKKSRCCLIQ